jgi:hypothetical protein
VRLNPYQPFQEIAMLNLTSLVRSLTVRASQFVNRLLGCQLQQADSIPPVSDSVAHTTEAETTAVPVVSDDRKPERLMVPTLADDTTTQMVEIEVTGTAQVEVKETEPAPITETITPEPVAVPKPEPAAFERPTRQCRNYRHPQTRVQCINQVPDDSRSGLCHDCEHPCSNCLQNLIPIWMQRCKPCHEGWTKLCKGCGVELWYVGPHYCSECGHQCARPGCKSVIPTDYKYCLDDLCQQTRQMEDDATWVAQTWPKPQSTSNKPHADRKAARKQRDKEFREAARGPNQGQGQKRTR